jgi:hypothetical protein
MGYVVLRDVPKNPSFTVFPASPLLVGPADAVMGALIANSVKVVERPALLTEAYRDFILETNAASPGKSVYTVGELTNADYIVVVYVNFIKVVKRETKEVLFSGRFSTTDPAQHVKQFLPALFGKDFLKKQKSGLPNPY